MSPLLKITLTLLWFIQFIVGVCSLDVRIAVFAESMRDISGLKIREKISSMKADVETGAGEGKKLIWSGLDTDWVPDRKELMSLQKAGNPSSVAISVQSCKRTVSSYQAVKDAFNEGTLMISVMEDYCVRPDKDQGFGFPVLQSIDDIVPILVDIRHWTKNVEKEKESTDVRSWENLVLLRDETIDINTLESIVNVFMSNVYDIHPATVTAYLPCFDGRCGGSFDMSVEDILEHHKEEALDKHFVLIGNAKFITNILLHANTKKMLDINRMWLAISTESPLDNLWRDLTTEKDSKSPIEDSNIAVVYKQTAEGCTVEPRGCQLDQAMKALTHGLSKLDAANALYGKTPSIPMKRKLIELIKTDLAEKAECGGCMRYLMQSTALIRSEDDIATTTQFMRTGTWSPMAGLEVFTYIFPVVAGDFMGKMIKVGIVNNPPESVVTYTPDGKVKSAEGMTVELIRELGSKMNFTVEYFSPKDKLFGLREKDGSWNGLIGILVKEEVDFVGNAMYLTKERVEAVAFTNAIDEEPYNLMTKRPEQDFTYLFTAPFTWDTWVCVIACIVAMGPLINIFHRTSKYYEYYDLRDGKGLFQLSNCAWYVFGAVVQQGGIHLPEAISGRLLIGFWWLFVIVTVTSYSGNLVAVLTFPRIVNPIGDIKDVIGTRHLKWAAFKGEALIETLEHTESSLLKDIYKGLEIVDLADNQTLFTQIANYEKVLIAAERQILQIIDEERIRNKRCDFAHVPSAVLRELAALPVPKRWPYLYRMNKEIKKIVESGLMMKWRKQYWPKENECTQISKQMSGETSKISIKHMWGSFVVLFLGFGGALLAFLYEVVYRRIYLGGIKKSPVVSARSDPRARGTQHVKRDPFASSISTIYPTPSKANLMYDSNEPEAVPDRFTYTTPREPKQSFMENRQTKRRF